MNKLEQLRAMIRRMDDALGIWGDVIGAVSIVALPFLSIWLLAGWGVGQ